MSKIYMHGIDISTWQNNIDLKPYKDGFVIIRVGFTFMTSFTPTLDNRCIRNMNECDKLGIPYGVYYYGMATTQAQAKKEAEFVLKTIKGRNIRVGVWYDIEDPDRYKGKSKKTISNICNAFCSTIEAAGYYTGIYSMESWFGTKIDCPKYDKWVASWGTNNGELQNDTSKIGTLHQYTSKPLDKDVMYVPLSTYASKPKTTTKPTATTAKKKTVDEIAKEVIAGKWGNGAEREKKLKAAGYDYDKVQAKVNEMLAPKYKVITYKVQKGDTLTAIAKKYGTTVDQIVKDNCIKNPNIILRGQKLKIRSKI